ncbi:MAG: hypothetical protein OS112_07645 [Methanoregula sp.]|nr:MAG: hypothetical protein OS112_07645 [Methanoregula sp.]
MDVIIARNEREVKDILGRYKNPDFLYPGEKSAPLITLLASGGAREVPLDLIQNEEFRQEYVKNYIDLIGGLGKQYHSRTWWATFVSSKNKFISQLLPDIFFLVSLLRFLEKREDRDLIIINPPPTILPSLELYCQEHSRRFIRHTGFFESFFHAAADAFSGITSRVRFVFRIWGKILISRWYFSRRVREKIDRDGRYYVVRSGFYERSIMGSKYHDSFFGTLPDFISRYKNVLILAGAIGNYREIARKIAGEQDHLIIPEEYFLSFADPIHALLAIRKNRIVLTDRIMCCGFDVTGVVGQELAKEFRLHIFEQYIYSSIITGLVKTITVDTFTTTYENNPWEKVCFGTLRDISPATKIIGYQHAALSKSSLNMIISSREKDFIPMPDRIVTVGDVTREFLIHEGNFDPERVKAGCGLRFAHLFSLAAKERIRHNSVLVTPEGVLTESVNLSDFAFKALHDNDTIQVVIRPHPALPYRDFKKNLVFDAGVCSNFSISKNDSVRADLDATDAVIYRGSTLALEALKMGIPVFYVAQSDIISVNPLFDFSGLTWTVRTEKELADAITMMYAMDPAEYIPKLRASQEFIDRYIARITDDRLQEFLM